MRALLDTNVLVSGVFFGGTPGRVVTAVADGRLSLVLSLEILDEYKRVGSELERRYLKLRGTFEPVVALLVASATVVDAPPLLAPVSADPDDDKFLAAADAAGASVIVSGDRHLLDVTGWRDILVFTPRQFVDEVLPPESRPRTSRAQIPPYWSRERDEKFIFREVVLALDSAALPSARRQGRHQNRASMSQRRSRPESRRSPACLPALAEGRAAVQTPWRCRTGRGSPNPNP